MNCLMPILWSVCDCLMVLSRLKWATLTINDSDDVGESAVGETCSG